MSEILTLTTQKPQKPTSATWSIDAIYVFANAPSLRVDLISNVGDRFTYQLLPIDAASTALIQTALSFINQGKFQTVQGKSLQRWLLDRIALDLPEFAGTTSGTPA